MMKERFSATSLKVGTDHTRYEGMHDGAEIGLDVLFASGYSKFSDQITPHIWITDPHNRPQRTGGYEGLWSIPVRWDYLTEENWDRSLDLLGGQIVFLAELARGNLIEIELTGPSRS